MFAPDAVARRLRLRRRSAFGLFALLAVTAAVHLGLALLCLRTDQAIAALAPPAAGSSEIAALDATRATIGSLAALLTLVAGLAVAGWLRSAAASLEVLVGSPVARGRARSWSRWRPLVAAVRPDRDEWWAADRIGSSRALGGAILAGAGFGVPLWLLGTSLASAATGNPASRAGLWLAAAGAMLLASTCGLVCMLVQGVRRREAIALRNVVPFHVRSPRWRSLAPGLVAVGALVLVATQPIEVGKESSCSVPGFECLALTVPSDRASSDPKADEMIIPFAIHRATADRPRLLVVAVGGPGSSGLLEAPGRIDGFDSRLVDTFDIVFFDQRGVGASGGRDCEISATAHARAAADDVAAAEAFVVDCLHEAGVRPDELPRYRTGEVIEDLEALRTRLGYDRLSLYGESYGTVVAQAYALAHPERVDALVLDAPVDLALGGPGFWRHAVDGFRASLEATLGDCVSDRACSADLPDALATYRSIVDRLGRGPVEVSYPGADGILTDTISLRTFELGVGSMLYTESGRMLVQRALAERDRGDWAPLARLAGSRWSFVDDPTASEFAYYAVLCGDYRFAPGDPHDARRFLEVASESVDRGPFSSLAYVGLPCVFWPSPRLTPLDGRGLTDAPFPVLVLTSSADPITRASDARTLAERLPQAWLVETSGGSHVTFGDGLACVDDRVVALLVDRRPPALPITRCRGNVTSGYMSLTPRDAGGYLDALDALVATDTEIYLAPEYRSWRRDRSLTFGCRYAGSVHVDPDADRDRLSLMGCVFARGLTLDGTGWLDRDTGAMRLDVRAGRNEVTYRAGPDGSRSVKGTWSGSPVDLTD